jgi:hypothetical protein
MKRDYRLYELGDEEFEALAVRICVEWLGEGVIPFAPGKDGGRDGKFHGKAAKFPDQTNPLEGHVVLQAKHVGIPGRSCSDQDFTRLLKAEHPKIKRLISEGICDHYIVFTNRRLTGGADEGLIKTLTSLGLKSAHLVADERIAIVLDMYTAIRQSLPNLHDDNPFQIEPDDLAEVIHAFHLFAQDLGETPFDADTDFARVRIGEKNQINGLSNHYYQEIIVAQSMPHFARIDQFLKNNRNKEYADLYYDSANEIKEQILLVRSKFENFDRVFNALYRQIQKQMTTFKHRRRLISIMLHHMYFHCNIGSSTVPVGISHVNP